MSLLRPSCLLALSAIALLVTACGSVRTVYDENGQVVTDDGSDGAKESDIFSAFEKRFDESFSEKKNAQGVPEARSRRVSSFQKELDSSRDAGMAYMTKAFGGTKEFSGRSSYGGTKVYDGRKEYEGGSAQSSITKDMKPDFMNRNRGLAHEDYQGDGLDRRDRAEGVYTDDHDASYTTRTSSYRRDEESGYFESRRDRTPAPPIRDHRSQQTKDIMNIRNILGRDKTDAAE